MRSIGLLTIGQAPRPDGLAREVARILGDDVRVIERGALDGLSSDQITRLAPNDDDYHLITMLRDGSSAVIAKRHILDRLQTQIDALESEQHVAATLLMCTGAFPDFRHEHPLVAPQEALYGTVAGMVGTGRIGAIVPLPSQVDNARIKWHASGIYDALIRSSNPYASDTVESAVSAARQLRRDGATMLFLDCFGFTLATKAAVQQAFQGPVVLARSMAARFVAEII